METLYLANGKRIPVWGISHTGHVSTKHMDSKVKKSRGDYYYYYYNFYYYLLWFSNLGLPYTY